MQFKFYIGTKVIFGKGCIRENKAEFGKIGKRAFIVTGGKSGKASGALDDVINLFKEMEIEYVIYDRIENNPTLENVKDGGVEAAKFKADFVVGIGGGSPLDAAKAIAVLTVNDIDPLELYKNSFDKKPLPIIAIPTTAGTGSEVTRYSILTRRDVQTKMSFGNDDTYPKLAFIDAAYTGSLPYEVVVNTAVDAFSHAVEGYVGNKSTNISDVFAVEAIEIFGKCLTNLIKNDIDFDTREKLLYMSTLGGMVIAHTGTTIMHGLGYSLTYFKGIPHGKANGLLMKEYFKFNYDTAREKIDKILSLLSISSLDEFGNTMDGLFKKEVNISEEEYNLFASLTMKMRSTLNNIRVVSAGDLVTILKNSFER